MTNKGSYVYMLLCSDGTLYTGWTTDVQARLKTHNSGRGARYTKTRRPVTLVYFETAPDRGSALSREAHIKKLTRKQKESLIFSDSNLLPADEKKKLSSLLSSFRRR